MAFRVVKELIRQPPILHETDEVRVRGRECVNLFFGEVLTVSKVTRIRGWVELFSQQ